MPTYTFIARDRSGSQHTGERESDDADSLTAELRSRGYLVIAVERSGVGETGAPSGLRAWLPATRFDVEIGFQQMATMVVSGLGLLQSLRTTAEQARRPAAAAVWTKIAESIEEGSSMSSALESHGRIFPESIVQLIRVGEHTGTLETAFNRCAEQLERMRQIRLTLLNALAYPLIVLFLSFGVTAFLVFGVIPKIERFLEGRGRSLPPLTQTLVDVSGYLREHAPEIAILASAGFVALVATRLWEPGRRFLDGILLKVPMIGGVIRLSATAVIARALGSLLESGVTLLASLQTVETLVGNRVLRERLREARQGVLRGESLAAGLDDRRCFMPMLSRMVAVGESTGALSTVLAEVSRFHEQQLLVTIRRLSGLVEPVVIVVVGGLVGFVYIAFFTALFSITGGVR